MNYHPKLDASAAEVSFLTILEVGFEVWLCLVWFF